MKKFHFLYIMLCLCFVALTNSCEQGDLQKSSPKDPVKITPRGDCDLCPDGNECCCAVSLAGLTTYAELHICGTNDGDAVFCEVEDPGVQCETIEGLQHSYFVLEDNVKESEPFCMLEERGFMIQNLSDFAVSLTISCTIDQTTPQSINVTIPANGRKYFETSASCGVQECD